eukprot:m.474658 g.474658  ORF g.474658 m.474658 type:complete len:181 (-) comp36729_c0_seq1:100-642(-)
MCYWPGTTDQVRPDVGWWKPRCPTPPLGGPTPFPNVWVENFFDGENGKHEDRDAALTKIRALTRISETRRIVFVALGMPSVITPARLQTWGITDAAGNLTQSPAVTAPAAALATAYRPQRGPYVGVFDVVAAGAGQAAMNARFGNATWYRLQRGLHVDVATPDFGGAWRLTFDDLLDQFI